MINHCLGQEHHSLCVVMTSGHEQDLTVVRWCAVCGGVVTDRDSDGRTNPGAIAPMRFPTCLSSLPVVDISDVDNEGEKCADDETTVR